MTSKFIDCASRKDLREVVLALRAAGIACRGYEYAGQCTQPGRGTVSFMKYYVQII